MFKTMNTATELSDPMARSNALREDIKLDPTSGRNDAPSRRGRVYFESDFEPRINDVIIGRGKKCYRHPGNIILRRLVSSMLDDYSKARNKLEKSNILASILSDIRKERGCTFIKFDPDAGLWFDAGDFLAREKVSQTFRDFLHEDYKSSNEFKKMHRKAQNLKADMDIASTKHKRHTKEQSKEKDLLGDQQGMETEPSATAATAGLGIGEELDGSNDMFPSLASLLPTASNLAGWFQDESSEPSQKPEQIIKNNKTTKIEATDNGAKNEDFEEHKHHKLENLEQIRSQAFAADNQNASSTSQFCPNSCTARTA